MAATAQRGMPQAGSVPQLPARLQNATAPSAFECLNDVHHWSCSHPTTCAYVALLWHQVVICVLHLQRKFVDEGFFSVLVATQQVLLWIKLVSAGALCQHLKRPGFVHQHGICVCAT